MVWLVVHLPAEVVGDDEGHHPAAAAPHACLQLPPIAIATTTTSCCCGELRHCRRGAALQPIPHRLHGACKLGQRGRLRSRANTSSSWPCSSSCRGPCWGGSKGAGRWGEQRGLGHQAGGCAGEAWDVHVEHWVCSHVPGGLQGAQCREVQVRRAKMRGVFAVNEAEIIMRSGHQAGYEQEVAC